MTASVEGHKMYWWWATIWQTHLYIYTTHTHILYLKSIFTSEYVTTGTGTGITVTLSAKSAKSAYVVLLCFCEKVKLRDVHGRVG